MVNEGGGKEVGGGRILLPSSGGSWRKGGGNQRGREWEKGVRTTQGGVRFRSEQREVGCYQGEFTECLVSIIKIYGGRFKTERKKGGGRVDMGRGAKNHREATIPERRCRTDPEKGD